MNQGSAVPSVARSAQSTVASLLLQQLRLNPHRVAVDDGDRHLTYTTFVERVRRLAGLLAGRGVGRGDRVAILSENRLEYLETYFAVAWLGAILACQNWRLSGRELAHCLDLVEPKVLLVSARHRPKLVELGRETRAITFSPAYEVALAAAEPAHLDLLETVEPEDPLLILYTSGTTGLPKGAVISHRAEIVRNLVIRAEFGVAPEDTFAAWSPLYHMGAAECSIGALMTGGKVTPVDGFDQDRLAEVIATEPLGWLLLMPGMVGAFADELERRGIVARGVKVCGVMADLVPPADIARITRLLDAPYANTFGATETGCPPCSSNLIPVGVAPARLSKQQSPFCEVRLVDPDDHEVPDGSAGELCMRGPTLFSGYWRAAEVNAQDFRGGWFHMGDVFVRNPDGTLDFVDRVKYLIKSGGENIYPAEIERVMLADPRVTEAAVVRRSDPKWGEVPVAFVARRDESLTADDLHRRCRDELAGYKQPKGIHFIDHDDFPRSASGKIQRHELEKRLADLGN
ncbi:citrate synthase [alpha proteobacterium BAL199]|jgi:acyl-CoA synthetase (AMP-forming)/AMP-acid ligase II|nr:citrate synthase [alpha proteobacterium BAL199]